MTLRVFPGNHPPAILSVLCGDPVPGGLACVAALRYRRMTPEVVLPVQVIILFCLNEGMRFLFHLICENRRMVEFVALCRHLAACGLPGEALPPLVVICAMYAPCGFSLSSGI